MNTLKNAQIQMKSDMILLILYKQNLYWKKKMEDDNIQGRLLTENKCSYRTIMAIGH